MLPLLYSVFGMEKGKRNKIKIEQFTKMLLFFLKKRSENLVFLVGNLDKFHYLFHCLTLYPITTSPTNTLCFEYGHLDREDNSIGCFWILDDICSKKYLISIGYWILDRVLVVKNYYSIDIRLIKILSSDTLYSFEMNRRIKYLIFTR